MSEQAPEKLPEPRYSVYGEHFRVDGILLQNRAFEVAVDLMLVTGDKQARIMNLALDETYVISGLGEKSLNSIG